ncbi:type VI secretion protein [Rouxiella sp. WC2420]|uniref:Type VI secretion protein n=1 Tax=Rouxiella sp. WC2420 TaxID=3234145 RepID=A0AB39VQW8_9GAMM
MGWQKAETITPKLPTAPLFLLWLLAGVMAVFSGVLLFILHASELIELLTRVDIWWLSITPPAAWLLLFSFRCWLWGKKVDEYKFFQQEAKFGHQQWQAWSERHLVILGSSISLPDSITAETICNGSANDIPWQMGCCRRLADLPLSDAATINLCISGIKNELNNLPVHLPLAVTLVTDLDSSAMTQALVMLWPTLFHQHKVPDEIIATSALSMNWVEERLKQPVKNVHLILIIQLNGEASYSDGLAALLLTSDDVVNKYRLPAQVRLLRPMPLNMLLFQQEISLFIKTQTAARHTSRILGDARKWEDFSADLSALSSIHGTLWQVTENELLEKWCGIAGPSSPWLLTALAAELANLRDESLLMLCSSGQEHFVSTVTLGSENEHIG